MNISLINCPYCGGRERIPCNKCGTQNEGNYEYCIECAEPLHIHQDLVDELRRPHRVPLITSICHPEQFSACSACGRLNPIQLNTCRCGNPLYPVLPQIEPPVRLNEYRDYPSPQLKPIRTTPNKRTHFLFFMLIGLPIMFLPYPPAMYVGGAMFLTFIIGGMLNWGHWYD